jgi:hypothetical protein
VALLDSGQKVVTQHLYFEQDEEDILPAGGPPEGHPLS